jgi:hypothetical protein
MAKGKNCIILKAEGELVDKECHDAISKIFTKLEMINERTKAHTIQIHELKEKIKELKKEIKNG